MAAPKPECPSHRPVRGRIAIVDHEALLGSLVCPFHFPFALLPTLKRILPMRKGQAGIRPREGWIEAYRSLEKMPGSVVVRFIEPVHVPEAAMMSLPHHTKAHDLLVPIYGWFSEDFETAGLKEVAALLSEAESRS